MTNVCNQREEIEDKNSILDFERGFSHVKIPQSQLGLKDIAWAPL
jgi:hypothetical protein